MQIETLSETIDPVYYSHDFIVTLLSHKLWLQNHNSIQYYPITSQQGYKYEGAFYDLLNDLNISKRYHLIITVLNGYKNAADYKGDLLVIKVPNTGIIEQIKNIYLTRELE